MSYKNLKAQLSAEDLNEIKESLQLVHKKLPFLIHLTPQERRRSYKMGDKSIGFVSNSLSVAQDNQDILPNKFDLEDFAQDYELSRTLMEVNRMLRQLSEQVDDTLIAVGSEAMQNSLRVYEYVKSAAKHEPGLKGVADELGDRFKKTRRRREPDEEKAPSQGME